jgi:ABC-type spermidine/putrescine transport system permease subunit II
VTLSTLVQAKIKRGPIPPEMRALTLIIFIVVLLVVIGITLYRNKTKNVKKIRKMRENHEF